MARRSERAFAAIVISVAGLSCLIGGLVLLVCLRLDADLLAVPVTLMTAGLILTVGGFSAIGRC